MREQEQRKISFQGIIKSVQPRSTVWRYRLDNRTHRTVGYNIFLTGIADGEEKNFAIAISENSRRSIDLNLSAMVRRIASSIRWESQEQFLIKIVAALMMRGGWMNFVLRIEMMKSRRRCKCHLR